MTYSVWLPLVLPGQVRVKNIESLMQAKATCTPGSDSAHLTLLIALTPRDLRQHRSESPSTYSLTSERYQG